MIFNKFVVLLKQAQEQKKENFTIYRSRKLKKFLEFLVTIGFIYGFHLDRGGYRFVIYLKYDSSWQPLIRDIKLVDPRRILDIRRKTPIHLYQDGYFWAFMSEDELLITYKGYPFCFIVF
jgi:ribosomal protein S8